MHTLSGGQVGIFLGPKYGSRDCDLDWPVMRATLVLWQTDGKWVTATPEPSDNKKCN